jgi:hypothetical protein
VFTDSNAGHTFFHADPQGLASICKVGRDEQISLPVGGLPAGHPGICASSAKR